MSKVKIKQITFCRPIRVKLPGRAPQIISEVRDVEGSEEIGGVRVGTRLYSWANVEYVEFEGGETTAPPARKGGR